MPKRCRSQTVRYTERPSRRHEPRWRSWRKGESRWRLSRRSGGFAANAHSKSQRVAPPLCASSEKAVRAAQFEQGFAPIEQRSALFAQRVESTG
jgi:hypothetical protein